MQRNVLESHDGQIAFSGAGCLLYHITKLRYLRLRWCSAASVVHMTRCGNKAMSVRSQKLNIVLSCETGDPAAATSPTPSADYVEYIPRLPYPSCTCLVTWIQASWRECYCCNALPTNWRALRFVLKKFGLDGTVERWGLAMLGSYPRQRYETTFLFPRCAYSLIHTASTEFDQIFGILQSIKRAKFCRFDYYERRYDLQKESSSISMGELSSLKRPIINELIIRNRSSLFSYPMV